MFTGKVSVGRRHQNMINKRKKKVGVASNRKIKKFSWDRVFFVENQLSFVRQFVNAVVYWKSWNTQVSRHISEWIGSVDEAKSVNVKQPTWTRIHGERVITFSEKKNFGLTIAGREIGWNFWKTTKSGGINRKSAVWTMLLVKFAFTKLLKAPDFSHCATSARTSGLTVVSAAVPRWYATFSNWKSRSNFKFRTAELDWSVIFSINYKIIKIFRHCNSLFSSVILSACRSRF